MMFTFNIGRPGIALVLFSLLFSTFPLLASQGLNASQAHGKQIYLHGRAGDDGDEIMATVGSDGFTLPATAMPCASCHGRYALGRREGGVIPTDIRWSELTKIYGHVHENGRSHEAFTEVSLARLIRSGRDPAHNQIDNSMPRYVISNKDMDDLISYLRFLEKDLDPGIDEKRIQVGTLLPLNGPLASLGSAMAQVMHAYFAELNKSGGIFGRKVDLLAIPHGTTPAETLDNLRSALSREGIFALVGAYTVGLDEAVLGVLNEVGAPLIAPFTLNPEASMFSNTSSFYMYSGFDDQARALVQQAYEKDAEKMVKMVIAGPHGDSIDRLISSVSDVLPKNYNDPPAPLRYPQGKLEADAMADAIQDNGSNAVLFLGSQTELKTLLEALDVRKLSPKIYLLSAFISRPLFDAPAAFDKRIFLAYPTLSSDITVAGKAEYLRLADLHALPHDHLQGQIAAFAASKLLIEGLRGAGKTLNREKMEHAIETLYRFDTGVTPPLTYGPNRRIGARGAHVMMVDLVKKTNTSVGDWREVK